MNTPSFFSKQVVAAAVSAVMLGGSFAQTPSDKPTVSGTFMGDGKDAKIQHVFVVTHEPFSDQAAIQIIFTEKDPAKSKNPKFDAGFKKLGSALLLSVFKNGEIFGCEVAHTAHPKSPFSALGGLRKIEDFKVTDTHVSGHVITPSEQDAFGQKWTVDLTFSAPLPKGAFAAVEPEKSEKKMTAKTKSKSDEDAEPAATGPKPAVAQLPLPAGAKDVEYKSVVQQITLNADASVSTVAKDFSAKLKAQGWKESPGSLMGKSNAILKRKMNGAELTAMVQPAGKGSTVKIFTQGFDWSNPPESAPTAAKPAKTDADSIEAEANRLIKDALKGIPSFK